MSKSRSRVKGKEHVELARARRQAESQADHYDPQPLPIWYKTIMFGLMILGLIWIIVYYLSSGALPIQAIGGWNILVGAGIALIGFVMTTRWQ